MKKLIALLLAVLLVPCYAFAEGLPLNVDGLSDLLNREAAPATEAPAENFLNSLDPAKLSTLFGSTPAATEAPAENFLNSLDPAKLSTLFGSTPAATEAPAQDFLNSLDPAKLSTLFGSTPAATEAPAENSLNSLDPTKLSTLFGSTPAATEAPAQDFLNSLDPAKLSTLFGSTPDATATPEAPAQNSLDPMKLQQLLNGTPAEPAAEPTPEPTAEPVAEPAAEPPVTDQLAGVTCESGVLTIRWNADEEGVRAYMQETGATANALKDLPAPLAELMNKLVVRAAWCDEHGRFCAEVLLGEGTLISFDATATDSGLFIGSNLFPGAVVTLTPNEMDELIEAVPELLSVNSDALGEIVASLPVETTVGSFVGDAYEGGVVCQTIELDAAVLRQLLPALEEDCSATLRIISDENAPIGLSLTVLNAAGEQMMTVSAGFGSDHAKLVVGFAVAHHTYFAELSIPNPDEDQLHLFTALYRDDAGVGYAAASQDPTCRLYETDFTLRVYDKDGAVAIDGDTRTLCLTEGLVTSRIEGSFSEDRGSVTESVAASDRPAFSCTATVADEPFAWPDHSVDKVLSLTNLDEQALADVMQTGSMNFSMTLIQQLPTELLYLLFLN